MAEENGVKFNLQKGIKQIVGEDGKVRGVELDDGSCVEADLVIVGVGIDLATRFVTGELTTEQDGGIRVDPYLKTSAEDVYAAGDIANFPYWVTGDRARIEHWNHASQQGEIAAFNMLGKGIPFDDIPFFWTRNYERSLQFIGFAKEYDEVHIDGSLEERKFLALYVKDDRILAAAALNRGTDIHVLKEAMRMGILPSASEIKDGTVTVDKLKEKIKSRKGSNTCRRKQCCQKKKKE